SAGRNSISTAAYPFDICRAASAYLESLSRPVAVHVGRLPARNFLEAYMKTVLSAALVLGFCGLAGAADKADPVGTWKCEYNIGDQKRTAELTIKKDGDKLAGTMSW